jgi:hypothetical protein
MKRSKLKGRFVFILCQAFERVRGGSSRFKQDHQQFEVRNSRKILRRKLPDFLLSGKAHMPRK